MIPFPMLSTTEQKAQTESSKVNKIFVSPAALELGPACAMMTTSDIVRRMSLQTNCPTAVQSYRTLTVAHMDISDNF